MLSWVIVAAAAIGGAWILREINKLDTDRREFVKVEKDGKTYNIERELYDVYGTSIIDEYIM